MSDHVHDCSGPDLTCPCGFKLTIPPICFSLHVMNGDKTLIDESFNCSGIYSVIEALRDAAKKLEYGE